MNKIVKYSLSADFVTAECRSSPVRFGRHLPAKVLSDALASRVAGPAGGELRRSCLLRSRASHRHRVAASPTVSSAPADREPPSPPLSRHRRPPAASPPPRRQRQPSKPAVRTRYIITLTARRASMPKIIILSRRHNAARHITVLLRPRSVARQVVFHVPAADTPCITPAPLNTPADGSVERPIVID